MAKFTNEIQTLYVAYFGRPAEVGGLNYWDKVITATGSSKQVAEAFAATAEYKDAFRGMTSAQTINQIYVQLFGHNADPAGLQYWSQGLERGNFTVANAVTTIATGALRSDFTALVSKVAGATLFTASIDTPVEEIAYSGAAANLRAKAFIASIVDPASLATAISNLDIVVNLAAPAKAGVDEATLIGQQTDAVPLF